MTGPSLVVGAGGLLGASLVRLLRDRGDDVRRARVRWSGPEALADLRRAFDEIASAGEPWRVYWCAGAGVTATPQEVLDAELDVLRSFTDVVAASASSSAGTFFYASSAGALYAGASAPPFDELSPVAPLAPYGRSKVAAEEIVSRLTGSGVRVVVGRISNIYGPGQNLAKPQGLISQLCLAHVTARPLGIYVSLDTLRDYLYVDDCADLVAALTDRGAALGPGAPAVVKILASGRAVSIAAILGELRRVYKRAPRVVLASSVHARAQARDLRFRSRVWPDLDLRPQRSLAAGISATGADIGRRWRLADGHR